MSLMIGSLGYLDTKNGITIWRWDDDELEDDDDDLRIVRHIVGFNNPNNDENYDNVMLCTYMHVWDDFDEMLLIGKFLWTNLL